MNHAGSQDDGVAGTAAAVAERATVIIVNATKHEVRGDSITYEQVVALAFNNNPPSGPNVVITVKYSRGADGQEGSMLPGDRVRIKTGMVFDATATDRS